MPEEHKAESTIVRPKPATFDLINDALRLAGDIINLSGATFGTDPATDYVGGLQGGLAIALDHPEVVRDLLSAIDEIKRLEGVEAGEPDAAAIVQTDADARAQFLAPLVDAALGKPPTLTTNFTPPNTAWEWN